MAAGWLSRTVRAAVFAAVCVLLAALGHVLMSGAPVPWWPLAAGALATGAAGFGLAGRERGLPVVVPVAVLAQVTLHELFSRAQSATSPGVVRTTLPGSSGMTAGHPHGPHATGPVAPAAPPGGGHSGHHLMGMAHGGSAVPDTDWAWLPLSSPMIGMYAAHLLAAVASGLWLGYGERAAFRLLRALAGLLAAPLRPPPAPCPPPHCPRVLSYRGGHRLPRPLLLVHAITSRGPPAVGLR
ncbi:hypothetical protein NX801_18300 [Streptomyces sp. LP05-1]|uniref:Integral membrane protein n=1 Tax=Streptomyces pyxinae TaxID=2970734 RepID=A0ABT2CJJ0_9ACTN|nr:hypothetical protein [Streptomyces sp. LP05-1]MCS0637580.1 hypothetical protein [Streptomyces sp. LP05-1]